MKLPPPPSSIQLHRVVVTGIGIVSPLAVGTEETWRKIISGKSGITRLEEESFQRLPVQIAGKVPRGSGEYDFDEDRFFEKGEVSRLSTFMQYALVAADEAVRNSGLASTFERDADSIAVSIGTGIGSLDDIQAAAAALKSSEKGYRKVSPYFVPRVLANLAAGAVSIRHGLRGPQLSPSTACATGAHALGAAFRMVQQGRATAALAGAAEATITPLAFAGFCKMKALCSNFNDAPTEGSRPFDAGRGGFVMGEGAAVLALERADAARARGAPVLAELRGCGLSGDAHHITAPHEDGRGALAAMRAALADAGLGPEHIDYVNAHATSTPIGDRAEAAAIDRLLVSGCRHQRSQVLVSSTKGATGHLLGAAGALEAALTALAIRDDCPPPTLNLKNPDPEPECFAYIMHPSDDQEPQRIADLTINCAISNSFGFGGTNTSLVFTKYCD
mmetsp:Transcript_31420/g.54224  ORF Transcript_31420/g.54224 Transcript_31420/m.54224 type:complete len:447 (+) Transcript_31420:23-1363(+)